MEVIVSISEKTGVGLRKKKKRTTFALLLDTMRLNVWRHEETQCFLAQLDPVRFFDNTVLICNSVTLSI